MRLSITGTAIAAGLLWGGAILFVGLINLARPEYGMDFLTMMTSVYPWFHYSHTLSSVAFGTVSGILGGAVAGCLFGWLYDAMLDVTSKLQALQGRHT
jgi:hypothetical protein